MNNDAPKGTPGNETHPFSPDQPSKKETGQNVIAEGTDESHALTEKKSDPAYSASQATPEDSGSSSESPNTQETGKPSLTEQPTPRSERRMNPYLAGIGIGASIVALFALTGNGLNMSKGIFPLAAWISAAMTGNPHPVLSLTPALLVLAGCFGGGFLFSLVFGGFSLRLERGARCRTKTRALFALAGGLLAGLALRTIPFGALDSSLSGTALLLTGPALFWAGFAISGFILTNLLRRQWND